MIHTLPPNIPVRPIAPSLPGPVAQGMSGEDGDRVGDAPAAPEHISDRTDDGNGKHEEGQRPRGHTDPRQPTPK